MPASSAAQNRPVSRRVATKAAQAETAGTVSTITLNDTRMPNTAVTGHMSRPTEGVVVAQARL